VFLGYLFFRLYKKESTRRQLVWYMTGGIAVLLAFFIFLVCNSSVSNLLENYHRLLRDPEHQGTFSFIVYMGDMCRLAGGRYGVILLAVTGAAALYPFIKNAVCKRWVRISMITAALVYTWFLLQKNITENDLFNNKIYFCHILSIVGAVYMPALYLAGGRRRHGALLLYAVGLCFSTGIAIGSNNGKNGYTYALTLCAAATVIYLFAVLPKKRILYAVSIPPVLLVAVVFFIVNVTGVYRDEPLPALDTALVSGPAAGLYTTAENGEKYQEVIRTIHTYLPERGYVLYAQLLPFGYLCGENLYPATPRLWRLNLDYEGFPEYYDILPDHKPDILFIIKDGYGLQKNAPVWSDYMRELVNSEDFYRVDTECAVIYQLKTNNADKGLS
ncbi:MAG: hypothetical protein FWE80_02205, partial [Oscillospiraceae bacterium]|nr:hypothetical protein [Oscillospiraceae bacterium]